MQLQLLDRVAGCSGLAAQRAQCWDRHQECGRQLEDLAGMGGPEQRQALEDLVTSVSTQCYAGLPIFLSIDSRAGGTGFQ